MVQGELGRAPDGGQARVGAQERAGDAKSPGSVRAVGPSVSGQGLWARGVDTWGLEGQIRLLGGNYYREVGVKLGLVW